MEFNQLMSEKLHYLFMVHGLERTEQSKNIVKYESDKLVVKLSHDQRENSNTLWVGRKDIYEVEIDNQIMQEYFNSDLKLSNLPQEIFVDNVLLFFKGDGKKFMEDNERALGRLEKFNEKRISKYTVNLLVKQKLEAANKAWKDGNYSDVIKYLDEISNVNLSTSFRKKYKIACQKLSNSKI